MTDVIWTKTPARDSHRVSPDAATVRAVPAARASFPTRHTPDLGVARRAQA